MSGAEEFFTTWGTLSADAPSYIERPADSELFAALERHQFCLVLGPRQMGKSSLMIHAMTRLREQGATFIYVDLQHLGSATDFERWFVNVLEQIKRTGRLQVNPNDWWMAHRHLEPPQRFLAFVEDILLTEISGDIILTFDEIDSLLSLPFSDDFFTMIRSLYNSRAVNPSLMRLAVVLVGVATPSSFIKDRTRTPFNIGESVTLSDFSKVETKPFQDVLGPGSTELVDRIFYWTSGQPQMVQKLAKAAYSWWVDERTAERLDIEVDQSYLRLRIEDSKHLTFIQEYLLDPGNNVRQTLRTYRQVLEGKYIENNEQSTVQSRLKLAGVVKAKNGLLEPRNLIYQNVFNLNWLRGHEPADPRRWFFGATAVAVVLLIALAWLLLMRTPSAANSLGRPLRVGITSWPGYTAGIVANNGLRPNRSCIFWDKHNLEVEFVLIEDTKLSTKAFASGGVDGVDVVWSTVDFLANKLPEYEEAGIKARAFMQVDWSRGGDAIVVNDRIKRIEDLKGERIALAMFTPSQWLLEYSLENSSLDDIDQDLIVKSLLDRRASTDALESFTSDAVNAAVLWEPDVTSAVQQRRNSHVLVSTAIAQNLIADVLIAREDFIAKHEEEFRGFIAGWLEGAKQADENRDKAVETLVRSLPKYEALGHEATERILQKVRLADLADNVRMFGLNGGDPLFDRIFNQAGAAWSKRGYIQRRMVPEQARNTFLLKTIYETSNITIPQSSFLAPPNEEVKTRPALLSKSINIYFAAGSSTLDTNSQNLLDHVATLARTYSNAYVRIVGNADDPGNPQFNQKISQARAQVVADFLIKHYDLHPNRFLVIGNGREKSKVDTGGEGPAANRRVDIEIVSAN